MQTKFLPKTLRQKKSQLFGLFLPFLVPMYKKQAKVFLQNICNISLSSQKNFSMKILQNKRGCLVLFYFALGAIVLDLLHARGVSHLWLRHSMLNPLAIRTSSVRKSAELRQCLRIELSHLYQIAY